MPSLNIQSYLETTKKEVQRSSFSNSSISPNPSISPVSNQTVSPKFEVVRNNNKSNENKRKAEENRIEAEIQGLKQINKQLQRNKIKEFVGFAPLGGVSRPAPRTKNVKNQK